MNATKQELFESFCRRVMTHYEKSRVNWELLHRTLDWLKAETEACRWGHPVETCRLTPNLAGYLIKNGFETLEAACSLSDVELVALPGMSRSYVVELRRKEREYAAAANAVELSGVDS